MPHIHELYDFTTSAFILHPTQPELCLHYHKKLNKWLQPGGHIELDEDPIEALAHELREETGLVLDDCEMLLQPDRPTGRGLKSLPIPFNVFTHFFDDTHQHIDLTYLVRANTEELSPQEGESQQIGWFTLQAVQDLHQQGQVFDNTLDIVQWIFSKNLT